jgi:two-component system nitrogen regulation response regulator GlnG
VDVRIIAATNKDLESMVKAKTFREDLYYRLNIVRIQMPPLRDRATDIPQIVDFCLQKLAKEKKTRVTKVSADALALLTKHNWPGNVRELENTIYRSAVIAQGDAIIVTDLPAALGGSVSPSNPPIETTGKSNLTVETALDFLHSQLIDSEAGMLTTVQRELAQRTLDKLDGDAAAAAKQLGLTKPALKKLLG